MYKQRRIPVRRNVLRLPRKPKTTVILSHCESEVSTPLLMSVMEREIVYCLRKQHFIF